MLAGWNDRVALYRVASLKRSNRRLQPIAITLCALVRHRPPWPPQTYSKSPYSEKNQFLADTTLFHTPPEPFYAHYRHPPMSSNTSIINFHLKAKLNGVLEKQGSRSHFLSIVVAPSETSHSRDGKAHMHDFLRMAEVVMARSFL